MPFYRRKWCCPDAGNPGSIGVTNGLIRSSYGMILCALCVGRRLGCRLGIAFDFGHQFRGDNILPDLLHFSLNLIPYCKFRIRGRIFTGVCAIFDFSAICPGSWYYQRTVGIEALNPQVKIHIRLHDLMGYSRGFPHIETCSDFSVVGAPGAASAHQVFGQSIPRFIIFNCDRDAHHPGCQGTGHRRPCLRSDNCQHNTCQIQPLLF